MTRNKNAPAVKLGHFLCNTAGFPLVCLLKKEGENIRVYHAQLKEVLKTFITANTRLKNVILPIGAKGTLTCDIVTCVLYIIQDIQEGDALCGRYGPHTSNIKRHIRNCDCKYEAR